jgi:serine/threonine-protein kinase
MVSVPGGKFMMGCDKQQDPTASPPHPVVVAPFYIDKTLVTNAQYVQFVRATGYAAPPGWEQGKYPSGQDNWPVTGVSWPGAQAYARWKGKRLPMESEWEFAARDSDGRLYPWGSNFNPRLTNSAETGLGHPEPVARHPEAASPFGVLDMSGNVWEWCEDDYNLYPGNAMKVEVPAGAKVIRGGSFESDRNHVTTTTRNLDLPVSQSSRIGFRCARSR